MGLAGRKQKQRISADPRNLSWADDASRFGLSYLSKFGWDASQGLGSSGDGMKTHLKVQQKLDMMGIGAQHQRDPNGIAWKQNKEFEALLKRLNESAEQEKGPDGEGTEDDARVRETLVGEAFVRARETNESSVTIRKRKHKDADGLDANEDTKKRRKKEKEKRQKSSFDNFATPAADPVAEPLPTLPPSKSRSKPVPKSRPMAHRARIRAAKCIAGKSASAIAEILGVAPSSSVSTLASTPTPTPPSSTTPVPDPPLSLDNLTTSSKSVADYFKEKLLACSSLLSSPALSSAPSGSTTPGLGATGLGPGLSIPDGEDVVPRRGIGSRAPAAPPPSQVLEGGSASGGGDSNTDGRDVLTEMTEKQRRKAERKAEKRKRREIGGQTTPEGLPTAVEEQLAEDAEMTRRSSKKDKKRREQKQQALADQPENDDDTTDKSHKHATEKKSKKERKKKRT